jgi:phenylacetate-CoA ligase
MGITRDQIKLRVGAFGAEPWTENMRTEIQERLGLKGFNIYGLSEIMGPSVSYECDCQNGSHINEDHFFPEIIDPETLQPLPAGQTGELVFTTLTKEGMPVLRYRTRDLCSLMPGECPCGRTNVRMTAIHGRSDDMLIIRGINVFPSQVESVVLSMEEFAPHYLLVVDRVKNLDTLQVQVELRQEYFTATLDTPAAIEELGKKLESKLRSVLSIGAKVLLKAPGTLERSQGKSAHVIDNRKLK